LLPFSTSLLAEFISFRLALFVYWLNIFAGGALIYACWAYARRAGRSAALLCVINTYVSIASSSSCSSTTRSVCGSRSSRA